MTMRKNTLFFFAILYVVRPHVCSFTNVGDLYLANEEISLIIDLKTSTVKAAFDALVGFETLKSKISVKCRYPFHTGEAEKNRRDEYLSLFNSSTVFLLESIKNELNTMHDVFLIDPITTTYPDDALMQSLEQIVVKGVVRTEEVFPVRLETTTSRSEATNATTTSSGKRKKRSDDSGDSASPVIINTNSKIDYTMTTKKEHSEDTVNIDDGSVLNYYDDMRTSIEALTEITDLVKGSTLNSNAGYMDICENALFISENHIMSLLTSLEKYINHLSLLLNGNLPKNIFTTNSYEKIKVKARLKHQIGASLNDLISFLQLPYEIYKLDDSLKLSVISPKLSEKFSLKKYINNLPPIHIKGATYSIEIQLEDNILGLGDNTNFITLQSNQLNECIESVSNYYCKIPIIYSDMNSIPDSCLLALHEDLSSRIFKACNFKIKRIDFSLQNLRHNIHYIYSKSPLTMTTTYINNTIYRNTTQGGEFLYLLDDQIKSVETRKFKIYREKDKPIQFQSNYVEDFSEARAMSPIKAYSFDDIDLDHLTNNYHGFFDPKQMTPVDYLDRHIKEPLYFGQFLIAAICMFLLLFILRIIAVVYDRLRNNLTSTNSMNCLNPRPSEDSEQRQRRNSDNTFAREMAKFLNTNTCRRMSSNTEVRRDFHRPDTSIIISTQDHEASVPAYEP